MRLKHYIIALVIFVLLGGFTGMGVHKHSFKQGRQSMADEIVIMVTNHESVSLQGTIIVPLKSVVDKLVNAGVDINVSFSEPTDYAPDGAHAVCYDCHELGRMASEAFFASKTQMRR